MTVVKAEVLKEWHELCRSELVDAFAEARGQDLVP